MEARKITIVSTKGFKKVIMSSATTLAELKSDLAANGIDYTDMAFYEGISKSELKSDESLLPHDLEYKGAITNELVFMLTNSEKKIRSGANDVRMAAYDAIKKNNLAGEIKAKFGKNFTQVKTDDLLAFVNASVKPAEAEPVNEIAAPLKAASFVNADALIAILDDLIDSMVKNGAVDTEIAESIVITTKSSVKVSEEPASVYSEDEISDMFKGIC